jgi:predicted lipoprotein with Yx(FWY)xxD motif
MQPGIRMAAAIVSVAGLLAACSVGSSQPAASGAATIMTATVGSQGTLIVAGANGMTLYHFAKDTPNSGTSACTATAGCITKWPPLTVPTGSTPVAGSGAGGTLGTITRPDDGSTQVTYKGLPLYFYSGDSAVGDANGIYPEWMATKP